ncbi:hypothetical protein BJF79_29140 [Actinomadura sp. CNU-125]|nr:hypothetical protein [Actinomadura sp. CNU-125]OLT37666.1 hypothetical protein BJF79_29140 [Actinomadura sp. CNU-125]
MTSAATVQGSENFAAYGLAGRAGSPGPPQTIGTASGWTRAWIAATSSGPNGARAIASRTAPTVACERRQAGYGLIPIRVVSHRSPSPSTMDAGSAGCADSASNTPCGPSKTVCGPLSPAAASRAAMMPDCAAKPGCRRFVAAPVPRKASSPPAWLPAIPSASAARAAVQPSSAR